MDSKEPRLIIHIIDNYGGFVELLVVTIGVIVYTCYGYAKLKRRVKRSVLR